MSPTLHTINSTQQHLLRRCLSCVSQFDTVVLLERGVRNALAGHVNAEDIQTLVKCCKKVVVIREDVNALDQAASLAAGINSIGYQDFVELAAEHNPIQSWY